MRDEIPALNGENFKNFEIINDFLILIIQDKSYEIYDMRKSETVKKVLLEYLIEDSKYSRENDVLVLKNS